MYHHPPSTPHLFLTIPQDPTHSKGFGPIMLSVTQLESPPQADRQTGWPPEAPDGGTGRERRSARSAVDTPHSVQGV